MSSIVVAFRLVVDSESTMETALEQSSGEDV